MPRARRGMVGPEGRGKWSHLEAQVERTSAQNAKNLICSSVTIQQSSPDFYPTGTGGLAKNQWPCSPTP